MANSTTTPLSPSRRETLYRVQAADGRGPWRPGLSKYWVEDDSEERLKRHPDILTAFGWKWRAEIPYGWACGCACRSLEALMSWFTPLERQRLESMGYAPVALMADKIIRESAEQVLFARRDALHVNVAPLSWRVEEAA